ncbi:hypothetical protein PQQ75_00970 [Paraburkholderia aspalathi]|uniref:hypothetical protein n=1 Tax=Paraburkholderia aspalathi TaxID=1324617 RepID=UPI0038BD53DE
MTSVVGANVDSWLKAMQSRTASTRPAHSNPFFSAIHLDENPGPFKSPLGTQITDSYGRNADSSAAAANTAAGVVNPESRPPTTIYEGIQTALTVARVSAGYDPLAQPPQGGGAYAGDSTHFSAFVDKLNAAPFLTLALNGAHTISCSSTNANDLIDAFVNRFDGTANQDIDTVKKAVENLVTAALSYASSEESLSYFTQAILGDDPNGVHIYLYASLFKIKAENNKGVIRLQSTYMLTEWGLSLSSEEWGRICQLFQNQQNESTEKWLAAMSTPKNPNSNLLASCFER